MKEKEPKKASRFRPEELEEIAAVVEEVNKRTVGTKTVPQGYTKCTGCGTLIPLDAEKCPFCPEPKPEPEPEPEEKDISGGIISMLEDEGEE